MCEQNVHKIVGGSIADEANLFCWRQLSEVHHMQLAAVAFESGKVPFFYFRLKIPLRNYTKNLLSTKFLYDESARQLSNT